MPVSLYQTTIPVFVKYLSNLLKLIEKGNTHAAQKKISATRLLHAKLAPDMFTFTKQVQYSYFMALETAVNLSGRPMPKFAYDEKTVEDLKLSLKRAIAFLKKIKPAEFNSVSKRKVKTFLYPKKKIGREQYVLMFALPNFFFHVTTAYDILRHVGVPLKKEDYLGV